jgi:hypothetical protein
VSMTGTGTMTIEEQQWRARTREPSADEKDRRQEGAREKDEKSKARRGRMSVAIQSRSTLVV